MKEATSGEELAAVRPTILVVEDDPPLRMAVCGELKDAGFHVFDAVDGLEALTILREQRSVALVFADISLPGSISGVNLGHVIRREYPLIKVLLTSGCPRRPESNFPFLPKPYHFNQVRMRIERLLAGA